MCILCRQCRSSKQQGGRKMKTPGPQQRSDSLRYSCLDQYSPAQSRSGKPAPVEGDENHDRPSSLQLERSNSMPSSRGRNLSTSIPPYLPSVVGSHSNGYEVHPYIRNPRGPAGAATTTRCLERRRFGNMTTRSTRREASPLVTGDDQRTTKSNPAQAPRSRLTSTHRQPPLLRTIERSQSCYTEEELLADVKKIDRARCLRRQSTVDSQSMTSLDSLPDMLSSTGMDGVSVTTSTRDLYRRSTPTSSSKPTTPVNRRPLPAAAPSSPELGTEIMFAAPSKSHASVKLTFYFTEYNQTMTILNVECFELSRAPSRSNTFMAKLSSTHRPLQKERTAPVNGSSNPFFFHEVLRMPFASIEEVRSSTLTVEVYLVHFTLGPLHKEKKIAIAHYDFNASQDVEGVNNICCDLQPVR
ncbi:uncharacterized protein LOC135824698 [Sycon ciliatum]|uniref:uncharacterized protein LOC135824698 n=1 Tax=Sycon ciliatum TaxID=27933 RepID=UPI0031F603A3